MLKICENNETNISLTLFSNNHITSDKIFELIKQNKFTQIFEGLSYIKNNSIVIEYKYFKYFASIQTYDAITNYIDSQITNILTTYSNFTIHINMKSISISDVDKHRNYICYISKFFSEKYPDLLYRCYIYNAPYIFEKIFTMIRIFIDKETQAKINIVKS